MLADGYEKKKQIAAGIPPSYTHFLHRPKFRVSTALSKRLKGLKRNEMKVEQVFPGFYCPSVAVWCDHQATEIAEAMA